MLSSEWYDTYPNVKSAMRVCVEQMCRNSDSMEVDEMAYPADEEPERHWEEVHAVGYAKCRAKGRGNIKSKDSKGTGKWQEDADYFPYTCHNCGEGGGGRLRSAARMKERGRERRLWCRCNRRPRGSGFLCG